MTARDGALCAFFAAFTAVLGLMPPLPVVPVLAVPVTLQTLGVMLAGVVLGGRRAGVAMALFVFLIAAGLPLLSGGRGGFGVLMGPTGGFILGWIPGAIVTGWLAGRSDKLDRFRLFAAAVVGGTGVVYACGILWLTLIAAIPIYAAATGSLVFLPGDLLKAGIAAYLGFAVRRALPAIMARRDTPS